MEDGLTRLDWAAPWMLPWATPGQTVATAVTQGLPVHQALNEALHEALNEDLNEVQVRSPQAAGRCPVRFVPHHMLPSGQAYEQFVYAQAQCPTRDNLHDLFNGLCWIKFPQAKRHLNAVQAAHIAAQGIGAQRGPVRDAVTVFDENGALLDAPQPLWDALLAHDWRRLFVDLRPLWREARLVIFGHALLEKLIYPRKGLVAHIWCAGSASKNIATRGDADPQRSGGISADAALAEQLTPAVLAGKPFTPLPVLGVPGWWAPNEDPGFYDDPLVFRARRAH